MENEEMTTNKSNILVGLHNQGELKAFTHYLQSVGYDVTPVDSVDAMLASMGIEHNSQPDSMYKCPYSVIIMDANLGMQGSHISGPMDTILMYVDHLLASDQNPVTAIGLTGYNEFYQRLREQEPVDGVHYFEKPVDLEEVISFIAPSTRRDQSSA